MAIWEISANEMIAEKTADIRVGPDIFFVICQDLMSTFLCDIWQLSDNFKKMSPNVKMSTLCKLTKASLFYICPTLADIIEYVAMERIEGLESCWAGRDAGAWPKKEEEKERQNCALSVPNLCRSCYGVHIDGEKGCRKEGCHFHHSIALFILHLLFYWLEKG